MFIVKNENRLFTRIDDGFRSRPPHKIATGISLAKLMFPYMPKSIDEHMLNDGSVTIAAPVFVVGHSQRRSQSPRSIYNNHVSVDGHGPPFTIITKKSKYSFMSTRKFSHCETSPTSHHPLSYLKQPP